MGMGFCVVIICKTIGIRDETMNVIELTDNNKFTFVIDHQRCDCYPHKELFTLPFTGTNRQGCSISDRIKNNL